MVTLSEWLEGENPPVQSVAIAADDCKASVNTQTTDPFSLFDEETYASQSSYRSVAVAASLAYEYGHQQQQKHHHHCCHGSFAFRGEDVAEMKKRTEEWEDDFSMLDLSRQSSSSSSLGGYGGIERRGGGRASSAQAAQNKHGEAIATTPANDREDTRHHQQQRQGKGGTNKSRGFRNNRLSTFAKARVSTFGRNVVTIGMMLSGKCERRVRVTRNKTVKKTASFGGKNQQSANEEERRQKNQPLGESGSGKRTPRIEMV